jgi:hypothetical protein
MKNVLADKLFTLYYVRISSKIILYIDDVHWIDFTELLSNVKAAEGDEVEVGVVVIF